jgi:hypothetical protein
MCPSEVMNGDVANSKDVPKQLMTSCFASVNDLYAVIFEHKMLERRFFFHFSQADTLEKAVLLN